MARVRIDVSKLGYIPDSEEIDPVHRLHFGDVLLNTRNTLELVGKVSIWRNELPVAYYNSNILRLEFSDEYCGNSQYFGYALNSAHSINSIRNLATGTTSVAAIYTRDLLKLQVPVPTINEQRHIVAALADADTQITVLERLIAKKRAIKLGMMQQVFALPKLECERAALGSITSMISGGTPDRSNDAYWSGDIPWISATTLKQLEVSSSDQRVTKAAVRAGSRMAPLNATLILVRGSALHSEIRASLVVAPVCFNQDVKAMVPLPGVEPKFLTYSIHANSARLLRLVTSAGNTAGVLNTKVIQDFDIWLPDRETQRRVVETFNDVSGELDILAARLSKARDIKIGMMQQLLTGRVRLPVESA